MVVWSDGSSVVSVLWYLCEISSLGNLKEVPAGPWFNIKMSSYQYRKSHCGDKTVVRSSYLHNGISYTGKMIFLYGTSPQKLAIMSAGSMGMVGSTWYCITVISLEYHSILQLDCLFNSLSSLTTNHIKLCIAGPCENKSRMQNNIK